MWGGLVFLYFCVVIPALVIGMIGWDRMERYLVENPKINQRLGGRPKRYVPLLPLRYYRASLNYRKFKMVLLLCPLYVCSYIFISIWTLFALSILSFFMIFEVRQN